MSEPAFDWNEDNVRHLARHGVTRDEFEFAAGSDPLLLDYENIDGEDRWTGLGATKALRVLTVVFTIRQGRVRAVTAYDANKSETRYFWKQRGT